MTNIDAQHTEYEVPEGLPTGEARVALMAKAGISEDQMRALEMQAEAQQRAYDAVEARTETWVSFDLRTGELGLGNDDYQTLLADLVQSHGANYWHLFSVIGPNQ